MTSPLQLSPEVSLGLDTPPLVEFHGGQLLPAVALALQPLFSAAQSAGFEPKIASGYRSFDRQLHIFNAKAEGRRPLLDSEGQPLAPHALTPEQRLHAILRWSALPGLSRHHWGTDLDIYDASICTDDYQLQLTQAECDGPMAAFHQWLSAWLAQQNQWYRPYHQDLGGVAPEPWHLSFRPLAEQREAGIDVRLLQATLEKAPLVLKSQVLADLPALVQRYTRVAR